MTDSKQMSSFTAQINLIHRNNIMKPYKYILLIIALLTQIVKNDPFGDLTVSPSSYTIQDTTDYNFTLKFMGDSTKNYTVPVGSDLMIYLPSQYPIVPPTTYTCQIFGWPTPYQNITCSFNYPTIKISNAFKTALVIVSRTQYTLRWVINSIKNPKYAALTGYFSGDIRFNNTLLFSAFAPSNYQGITFTPGKLNVKLSIWPTYTDQVSNLTVSITPSNSIPLTGYLKITFPMLWTGGVTNLLNNSGISLCLDINKQTNLNCGFDTPYPGYIVTMNINNVYDTQSSAPFTFNITNFKNPPTTDIAGSFIFQTYNSTDGNTKALIDQSAIISLSGMAAAPILSPKLSLSSYEQGTSVQGIFVGTFKNKIESTDLIYFYGPPQIDLSPITNITIYESQGVIVELTSSYIVCSCKSSITTSFPITFLFNLVKLPPYSITITSNYQIYVMRGTAFVYSVTLQSSITLQPGKVNVSVSSTSRQAGVTSNYYFNMTFTHEMSASSKITLQFSSLCFKISSSIQCQSSASVNCTITSTSNNIVEIKYFVVDKQTSVNISISNLINPSSVGVFPSIKIRTYNYFNNTYYLVDKNENDAYFTVIAHAMNFRDMNVTPDSHDVYASTQYNVWIRNNIDLLENSYMNVYFPNQINPSSASCNVALCVPGTTNGSSYVQIRNIGPLSSGAVSQYIIFNVINPISTQKTSPFRLQIYDPNGNLLQYLTSSSPQTMTKPSNLSVNIYPSSQRNSDICNYTITFSTTFSINALVALALIMPNIQGCPTCVSKFYNTTHNEFIFYNLNMSSNTYSFTVSNFSNYDNDQIQTILGGLLSNDLKYNYANGSTKLKTIDSSSPSFVYQFSRYQYYTLSDLTISNISSATLKSRVGFIKLQFPPLFEIASVNCTNADYSCVNTQKVIVLTVLTSGLLPQITIKNIMTPNINTNMTISFSTYTTSNHLIDQNSIIGWQADCLMPCKACQPSNSAFCTSCYSNTSITINVLFQKDNNTCVSKCGDYRYFDFSTNMCEKCDSSCGNCQNSSTICLSCPNNKFLLNNTCYNPCPNGYFSYLTSCISCTPSKHCRTCIDEKSCSSCSAPYFYFHKNYCDYTCPSQAPYAFNYVCQSCNVVDCQTCSSNDCAACISGKLLIGTSLCISSCSSNQVYNVTNKSCDTVIPNGSNGSNSTSNTTTTNNTSSSKVNINFLPMPFLILFILASIIIFILHFRNKLSAVPALYGIVGPVIFLCGITIIVVGFTSAFDSTLQYVGLYCVIVTLALIMLAGIVSTVLWYKLCGCQKIGIIISSLLHYSIIALLTSNFNRYNSYFIESHKYFWRKYKFLSKGSLASFVLFAIAGVLLCYGVSDKYSYLFFGGVELSLLNTIGLLLSIIWIWLPLKQPAIEQEQISQKSTEIILGSQVDKQTQKQAEQQKQQEHNKSRVSQVKTQGVKYQSKNKLSSANSTFQYNKLQSVIKVDKDKIMQALCQGYFRKNQKEVLKDIRTSEELNHLDDALQMNKYLGEQKEEIHQSIRKSTHNQSNIFEKEDTQYSEQNQDSPKNNTAQGSHIVGIQSRFYEKKVVKQKEKKQNQKQYEEDSGQSALFEQPLITKELDFQHNIIFQDFDEDNITQYHEEKTEKQESFQPHLPKDSSLGQIVNKKPLLVKVEGTQKSTIRGISPIFDRKKQQNKLTVEQFQDNFVQSRIQLFNQNVKIKPVFSKELKKKTSIELHYSKEISKKDKPIAEQDVIHADLEEILSVQDPFSLEYSEFDKFEQKNIDSGSSRKLYQKVDGDLVMKEKSIPRPGDLFIQASIHYQPSIQRNVPPQQKQKSRLRGRRNK